MENPLITTMNRKMLSASGSALHITGKPVIDTEIDTCVYTNVDVIADMNGDGIIGLDFQRSQNCIIDISKSCILMNNRKVDLVFEGQIGCYRVATAETVSVPPRSEIVVEGRVNDHISDHSQIGIIEPTDEFIKTEKGFVEGILVRSRDEVPLRLMNLSAQSQIVHAGTIVGHLSPIGEIITPINQDMSCANGNLPSHLKDLFDHIVKEGYENMMCKNANIFAQNDLDLATRTLCSTI
jgi:hypothetical protein